MKSRWRATRASGAKDYQMTAVVCCYTSGSLISTYRSEGGLCEQRWRSIHLRRGVLFVGVAYHLPVNTALEKCWCDGLHHWPTARREMEVRVKTFKGLPCLNAGPLDTVPRMAALIHLKIRIYLQQLLLLTTQLLRKLQPIKRLNKFVRKMQ